MAAEWEKNGKAPVQSKALEVFAIDISKQIGNTFAPNALQKEIQRVINESNKKEICECISNGSLFRTLNQQSEDNEYKEVSRSVNRLV